MHVAAHCLQHFPVQHLSLSSCDVQQALQTCMVQVYGFYDECQRKVWQPQRVAILHRGLRLPDVVGRKANLQP